MNYFSELQFFYFRIEPPPNIRFFISGISGGRAQTIP